jgi:hypothetical protein
LQNYNQTKGSIEQGLIEQAESEAQSLKNEVTSKSGDCYDQTSQNGRKDLEESFKKGREIAKRKYNDLHFKIYENGPFKIHLKVIKPYTPLVKGKKEKKWCQFEIFIFMANSEVSFQSIRQHARFIWEVTFSERMEANKVVDSHIIQMKGELHSFRDIWLLKTFPRIWS